MLLKYAQKIVLRVDKKYFEVTVNVVVRGLFLGRIMELGDGVRITRPAEVVDKMKEEIKRLYAAYGM